MTSGKRKVYHIEVEDRLSNLPDVIIAKILSCLRTKETVKTSILSTRWKSVWASVPTLDLCDSDFRFEGEWHNDLNVRSRFLTFLDKVLISRKWPSFEKISIDGSKVDPYLIISWIRAALERNVSDLNVDISKCFVDPPCEFTPNLFSYNKLVVLRLRLDIAIDFPTATYCFPNLKVLELVNIIYKNDDSAPNLLSSCPVLEDLFIARSGFDNLGTLNLTSRTLKRLEVYSGFDDENICVERCFAEKMNIDIVQKMVINASTLESLDISCLVTNEYVVKDLSSLVEAKLEISNICSSFITYNNYEMCLFEFLGGISNAKFLTLGSYTIESLSRADSYIMPTFYNLTRLEILGFDNSENVKWKLVLEILKSSPLLEILILGAFCFAPYEECCEVSELDVPNCLVSHLKTVKITFFDSEDDVEKVGYLLTNAQVLEKMTITILDSNENLKRYICDLISENSRASVTSSDGEIIVIFH